MEKSVTIIGAGVGGLFTGAILAKEGFKVTIIEKNATIGGGLQSFRRFGEVFDTGMHVVGGLNPGGNIYRICQYLGIADKIQCPPVDPVCSDTIYFACDKIKYQISTGREGFISSVASYFPSYKDNIINYVDAVHRLADEVDLFNLRPSYTIFPKHSEEFFMAADAFIAKYVSDTKLQNLLAYMNPFYGGRPGQTPAYIHAIITSLYMEGSGRFAGGTASFANLLADVVKSHGGSVFTGDGVKSIQMEGKEISGLETESGRTFKSNFYISSVHPCTLLKLLPETAFTRAYRDRINSVPNSYSAFLLYLKLKPESFPYINTTEYYMTEYKDVWNFGRDDKPWPMGFMFMTPPEPSQGPYSTKVLVTAPMLFSTVEKWADTKTGRRGPEYEAFKASCVEKLMEKIEEIHPGIGSLIEGVNTATPLTIRDYYAVKEGSICGFSKDCNNILQSQLPVVTKIPNLYLTGQNNNLHGFCGTALTSITTSEALLGQNYVINKIASLQ